MNNSDFRKRYDQLSKEFLIEYGKGNSNVVLSPVSIIALLCMAADSTGSETRDEIIKLICGEDDYEKFRESVQKLCTLLSDDLRCVMVRVFQTAGIQDCETGWNSGKSPDILSKFSDVLCLRIHVHRNHMRYRRSDNHTCLRLDHQAR